MNPKPKPYIVEGYEITPHGITRALIDGDLTDIEAAEWIEKLYAHRCAQAIALITDEKVLTQRFLSWPVPASVYPDGIPGKPGRSGTNLLSVMEAEEMFRYIFSADAVAAERRHQYAITGKCPGCGPDLGACVCAQRAPDER